MDVTSSLPLMENSRESHLPSGLRAFGQTLSCGLLLTTACISVDWNSAPSYNSFKTTQTTESLCHMNKLGGPRFFQVSHQTLEQQLEFSHSLIQRVSIPLRMILVMSDPLWQCSK